ncbi:MAG: YceH family protein [Lysobacterales bacterium]
MSLTRELNSVEARIVGCLIEKEATTPEQYPLTLNGLRTACNQKSSRHPVMALESGEIGHALRQMADLRLVSEIRGSRVEKYQHHFAEVAEVLKKEQAVLCVLMLRGAQTPGEIRTRCQRIHEFQDLDDLHFILDRLMEREPSLVVRLPRGPGQKDDRYHHLLSGEPSPEMVAAATAPTSSSAPRASLEARLDALTQRVEALESKLEQPQE